MLWYLNIVKRRPIEAKHALKTAIASIIAMAIYLYFNIPGGYWIVISALLVMQSSLETGRMESTTRAGYERIIGTIIGAGIGLLGYFLVAQNEWLNLPVGFVIVFVATYFIEHFAGYKMASATAIIVMLISSHYHEPWDYAMYRSFAIILGCCIAVLTTVTIFPYRAKEQLREQLAQTLRLIGKLYQTLLFVYIEQNSPPTASKPIITRIRKMIASNNRLFTEISSHKFNAAPNEYAYHSILTLEENLFNALMQIYQAEKKPNPGIFSKEIDQCLRNLQKPTYQFFNQISKKILNPKAKIAHAEINQTIVQLQSVMEKLPTSRQDPTATAQTLEQKYQFFAFYHGLKHATDLLLELHQKLNHHPQHK